jgi:hypothetical protein
LELFIDTDPGSSDHEPCCVNSLHLNVAVRASATIHFDMDSLFEMDAIRHVWPDIIDSANGPAAPTD